MKSLTSQSEIISVPSKTFLWGEYSALVGGSAAVVATSPYFLFSKAPIFESKTLISKKFSIHPHSPAGVFLTYAKQTLLHQAQDLDSLMECHLFDPHHGGGGFGRSTAELIYVFKSLSDRLDMDSQSLWKLYRQLSNKKLPPSGYDLISQLHPGFNLMSTVEDQLRFSSKPWPFTRLGFALFKTNKKVNTHDAIANLLPERLRVVANAAEVLTQSYLMSDQESFISNIKKLALTLDSNQFFCDETKTILAKLASNPLIEAAKGCGALGADVVAIFYKKQNKPQILKQIKDEFKDNLSFVTAEDEVTS